MCKYLVFICNYFCLIRLFAFILIYLKINKYIRSIINYSIFQDCNHLPKGKCVNGRMGSNQFIPELSLLLLKFWIIVVSCLGEGILCEFWSGGSLPSMIFHTTDMENLILQYVIWASMCSLIYVYDFSFHMLCIGRFHIYIFCVWKHTYKS